MGKGLEFLTDAQLNEIHRTSLDILDRVGVRFHDQEALALFREHGADVDGETVRLKPDFVNRRVACAPRQFTLHGRNADRDVVIGGDGIVFAPPYGAPFVHDIVRGRRRGTARDYEDLARLVGASRHVQVNGGILVEPVDLPEQTRHLDMLLMAAINSDKPFMGNAGGGERARDSIDFAAALFGGEEVLRRRPGIIALVNSTTPLIYDERMVEALREYARARQPVIIASLAMAGATSPTTLAGTLALQNAEVLAGITYAQMVSEGTPVIYGSASSITEMRYASLAIGAPETAIITCSTAQLARYYGVPSRGGGGLTDSKAPDEQGAYESMLNLMAAGAAGINFVLHSVGILESYMTAGFEKLILDDEICGMILRFRKGFAVDDDTLCRDLVASVGIGGHFLAEEHTYHNFRSELWQPSLSDRTTRDVWNKNGARTAVERAHEKWQSILSGYQAPSLDAGTRERLAEFVSRRKEAILARGESKQSPRTN